MKNHIVLLGACLLLATPSFSQSARPMFAEPGISADGREIAFISGGDIWSVPTAGGEARLLVAQEGFESRPLFAPDGKAVAFTTNRTGNGDVYIVFLETGELRRLTFDDARDDINAWSPDSRSIYFSSTGSEVSGLADIWRVSASGGTPVRILQEVYVNEYFASPSPDGSLLAFNARGISSNQWWRNGHSHLDESEIWTYSEKNGQLEQLTNRGAKEIWPMWGADGSSIYYVSDRSGRENLWTKSLKGDARQLTKFNEGRVLWPSISRDGMTIVFERDFSIWKYDVATGKTEAINITRRGALTTPSVQNLKLNNEFSEMVLSPDGKKVAFTVRGEVFAASAKDGGDAARITFTAAEESQPAWSNDSKHLFFVADDNGASVIVQYTFADRRTRRLTEGGLNSEAPVCSPDGKSLAYTGNGKELRVMDLATAKDKVVASGYLGRGPFTSSNAIAWSHDSKWIAFSAVGAKTFRNVFIVSPAGGVATQVSFLSNTFGGAVCWSPDGKYLLFNTRQRTEDGQIARIDLQPRSPLFQENKFDDLFVETKKQSAPKPASVKDTVTTTSSAVNIQFTGIRQRMSYLPVGMDVQSMSISNEGKTLLFTATSGGQTNLYTYPLDELVREQAVAKQLTSTSGQKGDPQFTPDDKEVIFLEQGKLMRVTLESRQAKGIDATAELAVDFTQQKATLFGQAWHIQDDFFYDSLHHGADWNAVKKKFEPVALGTQTPDELRRVISLMLGELNASHSGIGGPQNQNVTAVGRAGLQFDRTEYEKNGRLKVASITPLGPADVSGSIKAGDYILAVDDTVLTRSMNFDQLLLNKINKRVSLSVSATPAMKDARTVKLRPINMATDKRLLYRQWVQVQRDYVNKVSGGRLGYVHMFDMSSGSLDQLYLDLDVENHAKEGVVVDIRNNNGGFVNAYALDVLSRKGYMTMTVRGMPSAPARTQLGQRALEAPTVLVTNQHSLSDAEDFTEGYRTLGLGKVVGEPTSGWIIYTSSFTLVDGSVMRLPFIRITDHEGKNMELSPRQVDVAVTRKLGETAKATDTQLDAAVKTLLSQLDENKPMGTKLGTAK